MFSSLITSAILLSSPMTQSSHKTEVQVNICDTVEHISTQLNLDLKKPQSDEITYFIENKNLELFDQKWVFKIVKTASQQTATVILKNNESEEIESGLNINSKNKKCEYDLHGTYEKLACKMSSEIDLKILEKHLNNKNYSAILSKDQKQWLKESNVSLPTDLKLSPAFSDRDYVIQNELKTATFGLSTNYKGQYFLEISTRSNESENKYAVQKYLIDFLNSKNIQLCNDQGPINTKEKLKSVY